LNLFDDAISAITASIPPVLWRAAIIAEVLACLIRSILLLQYTLQALLALGGGVLGLGSNIAAALLLA